MPNSHSLPIINIHTDGLDMRTDHLEDSFNLMDTLLLWDKIFEFIPERIPIQGSLLNMPNPLNIQVDQITPSALIQIFSENLHYQKNMRKLEYSMQGLMWTEPMQIYDDNNHDNKQTLFEDTMPLWLARKIRDEYSESKDDKFPRSRPARPTYCRTSSVTYPELFQQIVTKIPALKNGIIPIPNTSEYGCLTRPYFEINVKEIGAIPWKLKLGYYSKNIGFKFEVIGNTLYFPNMPNISISFDTIPSLIKSEDDGSYYTLDQSIEEEFIGHHIIHLHDIKCTYKILNWNILDKILIVSSKFHPPYALNSDGLGAFFRYKIR